MKERLTFSRLEMKTIPQLQMLKSPNYSSRSAHIAL